MDEGYCVIEFFDGPHGPLSDYVHVEANAAYENNAGIPNASAVPILKSGVEIDLLFTDVVMPGPLRSPELAKMARELFPGIAVLFTSGYAENAIVHGGRPDPGVNLLTKPYSGNTLGMRIRDALQRKGEA